MNHEYQEQYDEVMSRAFHLFRRILLTKLVAMKHCRRVHKEYIRNRRTSD